jgi:RNA polymerase sigma-B factor
VAAELAPREPDALWVDYFASRGINERNALTEHYLYLAGRVARRFAGRGVDLDDLTQVASVALIGAVERFDPQKNARFATFAAATLTGAVRNYFRDKAGVMRLSRNHFELYGRMRAARDSLAASLGREPTVQEIARETGVAEETALEAIESRRAVSALSLDAPSAEPEDGEPGGLGMAVGAEESGFERVEDRDLLTRAMAGLPPDERRLLALRFAAQRSQSETARRMGSSQMRVSRMERRVLERLRLGLEENN